MKWPNVLRVGLVYSPATEADRDQVREDQRRTNEAYEQQSITDWNEREDGDEA